jgi:fatty-acyl-CoA synthase
MTEAVDWLERRAKLSPDKLALIDTLEGRELTYRQWNQQVNQTAHFLRNRFGVRKGDRITILATNSVEYLDIWFACNKLGAILQNMNWKLALPEIELLIQDTKPKALVYSSEFTDSVHRLQLRDDIPSLEAFIAIDQKASERDSLLSERSEHRIIQPERPEMSHRDPWVICYTGGTTGLPKGAVLTIENITWNAINTCMSWGIGYNDVAILNAPLFHTGAMNVFTSPLVYSGGTSVVCSTFNVEQVFDLISSGLVSIFFGVPTMFSMMQNHSRWDSTDFAHLKFIISGGAPCPLPIFEKFWEKGVDFKTGYGLTEAGPNTFWLPSSEVKLKPGAVGYPLMNVEVKLHDSSGMPITEPDIAGELLIRGPHRIPGYWNNPEATADAIDEEGWLHTGDLAIYDEDGAYTVVGRSKEMYITGGENIYPAEIESMLHSHEWVAEAAVFGVPDTKWGEVGLAVIALKPGYTLTAREVSQFLKERIAKYKVPRSFHFIDELPKTGAGKINKKRLKEEFGKLEG